MKKSIGFTLIELVITIVILSIITVTILAKFVDLRSSATLSTLKGMQAALNSSTDITHAYILLHSELRTTNNNGVSRITLDNGETIRLRGDYPDGRWANNFEHVVEISDVTTVTSADCDVETNWCVRNRGTNWFSSRGIGSEGRGFIIFANGTNHNNDNCYLYYYTPNASDVEGSGEKPYTGIIDSDC